jgi:hypothetical protein
VCNNWIRFQLWKWISFALLVTFDEEKYRELAAPAFVKSLESFNLLCGNKNYMLGDFVWGKENPTMFWS